MSTSHFDILVLGSSPAARMAAALCAKGGRKVLLLDSDCSPPPAAWCHGSLHLDRLLETLGGRSCLHPTLPFQVHAGDTRLTVHGRQPLAAELLREHRPQQAQLLTLLGNLDREGMQLEELLWHSGGLPLLGWRSRWRCRWQLLRRGRLPASLHRPLARMLAPLGPSARTTLETLFAGLALAPAAALSQAEAALLWHCASRLEALHWTPFDELLSKRFEQFHGKVEPLASLKELKRRPDGRFELAVKGHQGANAGSLLFGDHRAATLLPPEIQAALPAPARGQRLAATLTLGHPSPLLAPGVLLDHPGGLRLALPKATEDDLAIEMGFTPDVAADAWLFRLQAALPFTEIAAVPSGTESSAEGQGKIRRQPFPGARSVLQVAPGVYLADGKGVLPNLGLPGDAILATTLSNHLLQPPRSRTH